MLAMFMKWAPGAQCKGHKTLGLWVFMKPYHHMSCLRQKVNIFKISVYFKLL